jgi:UDP-N-acetylmuramate--alanine ligase
MKEQKDIRQMINSRSGVGGFVGLSIYFIGIGGIGMSALARYFKNRGATVSGYDRSITPLTRELED